MSYNTGLLREYLLSSLFTLSKRLTNTRRELPTAAQLKKASDQY